MTIAFYLWCGFGALGCIVLCRLCFAFLQGFNRKMEIEEFDFRYLAAAAGLAVLNHLWTLFWALNAFNCLGVFA